MISSRASSHHCQQEQRRVVARQHARRRRVNLPMGKEFLPLDSPTQDVVELKQEQEHISDNTPSDVAAPLLCTRTTVSTQTKEVGIKPGYRVGIVDIGCMGHLGIQFAKAMGAAVVLAFSRFANKEQEIPRLGAYELVVYTDEKQAADSADSVDILLITADANNMAYTLFPPSSTKVFCDEK
ncbi:hypothetical protein PF004_g16943 [Phytophthora fragariae]|uniref:D-isomer specific 2-hydroxyacid dehydrogenase NAD-binding domain-containing protein n=1 Tax=Phytophthora fragariae TaxID=53985 RepID=A0A6G0NGV7_9STRA|nr:hypothetical protein PF004_g16943 [Phytophthora fragariae]